MGLKATTLVPRCCLVSQEKRQMVVGGCDLDMSYITDRILAMSYRAGLTRSMYQNHMVHAKEVLEKRHFGHYKVYNLCIDQDYDPSHSNDLVEKYPFDNNHAPSLQMVKEFCESVHSWLSADSNNIVFIHCMADKGQIGMMVSCYLVYKDMLAEEALRVYAEKRTTTNNLGVMIPSQKRYVNYWQESVSFPNGLPPEINLPKPCSIELRRIRLYDTKNIDTVFFIVSEMQDVAAQPYRSPVANCRNFCSKMNYNGFGNSEIEEEEELPSCLDYYFSKTVQVTGDVCVTFYEKNIGGRLFYTCFNTAFIGNNFIQLSITELDKVGNKGKSIAGPGFRMELLFSPTNPNPNDSYR